MFCDKAKEYLSQKGVRFQEKDIAQDPSALDDLGQADATWFGGGDQGVGADDAR